MTRDEGHGMQPEVDVIPGARRAFTLDLEPEASIHLKLSDLYSDSHPLDRYHVTLLS